MQIIDGKLVLGTHDCWRCDENHEVNETEYIACPQCDGTGRGPRGGRNGCKRCHGLRRVHEHTGRKVPCENCNGTGQAPDDFYGRVPDEVWRSLEFRVHRNPRRAQTFYEAHIGAGCWSTTDYGDHKKLTDEELIEKVRDRSNSGVQACKIIRDTGYRLYLDEGHPDRRESDPSLPEYIGIFTNDQGYTVAAVFDGLPKVRA